MQQQAKAMAMGVPKTGQSSNPDPFQSSGGPRYMSGPANDPPRALNTMTSPFRQLQKPPSLQESIQNLGASRGTSDLTFPSQQTRSNNVSPFKTAPKISNPPPSFEPAIPKQSYIPDIQPQPALPKQTYIPDMQPQQKMTMNNSFKSNFDLPKQNYGQPSNIQPTNNIHQAPFEQRSRNSMTSEPPPQQYYQGRKGNREGFRPQIDSSNFFLPRIEMDQEDERTIRPDTLHVYGVDYMSESDVLRYFTTYNPIRVEWINDSSCNVVFSSPDEVRRTMMSLAISKPSQDKYWREGFPVFIEGVQRKLFFRYACAKDVKDFSTKGNQSQYYKYAREKKMKGQKGKGGPRRGGRKPNGGMRQQGNGPLLHKPIQKMGNRPRYNQQKRNFGSSNDGGDFQPYGGGGQIDSFSSNPPRPFPNYQ
eukprot:TRINITY_DN10449_c0_g1_i2.p1 TRINITY_DN10449_c0_g1~~TRINITY_DN10449_c0_g1_i2.p1  ORF type:complete len:419 (-),score=85.05 TRINITY_DN10449_c0_g1_i2:28-1284(-)